MQRRAIPLSISIAALAAQSLGLAASTLAASPVDVPFASTEAEQTWVVPADVTLIHVVLKGGRGSGGGSPAIVTGDLVVNPGDTLYVEVGSQGRPGTSGGFNGGGYPGAGDTSRGGGGGASDIRTVARANAGSLNSRLIVAAGSGGQGNSGLGGDAGAAAPGTGGGGAGTAAAGGAGGTGPSGGHPGALGTGGNGGGTASTNAAGGGGGGGGYYGGGGGSGASTNFDTVSYGGGGGSSFVGSATNTSVALDPTVTFAGSITITYTPGPAPTPTPVDNGTVHAQFSVPTSAACLELSTTSIDFGSVHLGSQSTAATPDITVTSCSGTPEDLFAHGSDATATGVTWTLVGGSATCADTLGTDNYRMALESTAGTVGLSTTNAALGTLAVGDTSTQTARIFAACPGSTGAGELMTTQITFIAVEGS